MTTEVQRFYRYKVKLGAPLVYYTTAHSPCSFCGNLASTGTIHAEYAEPGGYFTFCNRHADQLLYSNRRL